MKKIETMTVYDAVQEVNKLEKELNNIKEYTYVGVTIPPRYSLGNNKLLDVDATLIRRRIVLDNYFELKSRWDYGPEKYVEDTFKDMTKNIDRFYKLRTAIKKFNDSQYIIFKSSKISISEAFILIEKIIMERDLYVAALEQYITAKNNKSELEVLARSNWYVNIKIFNPNNIGSHYKRDIELCNKRLKTLNNKIEKKWKAETISI